MIIKKDWLTINFTPNGMREVRGIVIHSMWGTYAGSIAWFKNPSSKASAHYLISAEGEITQMVRDTDMAWHAGVIDPVAEQYTWAMPNPNFYMIGIELEDKRDVNWMYPEKQREAAAWLVNMLMTTYNIPEERILQHKQLNPSRRSDPVGNFAWEWLLNKAGVNDDMARAIKLLEDFMNKYGHSNLEGAMRALIGAHDDNAYCQTDLTNCREANDNAKKECEKTVAEAISKNDAKWQSELESAKKESETLQAELDKCKSTKCEDMTWQELFRLAWQKFFDRG